MILISEIYFMIAQLVVIILFFLLKKNNDSVKREIHLFASPFHFSILIAAAIAIGYFLNKDVQLFCITVDWVNWILIPFGIFLIGNGLFKNLIGEKINLLILGIGIFISTYIILFGSTNYLIFIVLELFAIVPIFLLSRFLNRKFNTTFFDAFNLLGVAVLLPFVIIYWAVKQMKIKSIQEKILLGTIPVLILCVGIFLTFRMNKIIKSVNDSDNTIEIFENIIKNKTDRYLTELLLGAHWKYHTEICMVDGWRPPFHDPVLGFSYLVFYSLESFDHYEKSFGSKEVYRKIFPNENTTFECRCAKHQTILD